MLLTPRLRPKAVFVNRVAMPVFPQTGGKTPHGEPQFLGIARNIIGAVVRPLRPYWQNKPIMHGPKGDRPPSPAHRAALRSRSLRMDRTEWKIVKDQHNLAVGDLIFQQAGHGFR